VSPTPADQHYQRAVPFVERGDWAAAEGWLLKARALVGPLDPEVGDALGYVLLMQGEFRATLAVLEPLLQQPGCSFWIAHKLGDAHRALHHGLEAVGYYRQALAQGSSSALTARNLLQVLHAEDPALALAELEGWPEPLPEARLEGARQAALQVPGLELAAWLEARGLATAELLQRLAVQRLYGLEPQGLELQGDDAWAEALQQRLQRLGLAQR
jgi:hypothetical protein